MKWVDKIHYLFTSYAYPPRIWYYHQDENSGYGALHILLSRVYYEI